MKVVFEKKFLKDIDSIDNKRTKRIAEEFIDEVENTDNLRELKGIKKLKRHKYNYRKRIGDYRIGLHIEENTVEFIRFLHRKDIYKYFP